MSQKIHEEKLSENANIPDEYMSFKNAAGRIYCHLVNRELRRDMLEKVPYQSFLDLAVICYAEIPVNVSDDSREGTASACVTHSLLEKWGVTEKQLFRIARANTLRSKPALFRPLNEILTGLYAVVDEPGDQAAHEEQSSELYMLSNIQCRMGAVAMTYPDRLKEIGSRLDSDFYVIPSSVHECLVIAADGIDSGDLNNIVRQINKNELEPEDVLSDHVYFYSRKDGKLLMD